MVRGEMDSLPPQKSAMLGEWVGVAYQGTEFYRLDLRSDGRDTFVRMHPDDSCESYLITDWDLKPSKLKVSNDRDRLAEQIEITCLMVDRRYIKLEVRGSGKQWSRSVTLYKQDEWTARLKVTRKAAKKASPR